MKSLVQSPAVVFELKSNDLRANAKIPNTFVYSGTGCAGENKSPELHWSGAPEDAKSFAVTVYDPDSPTGSGFWHWIVFNIPASVSSLATGWKNDVGASEVQNDLGISAYSGPCPPPGKPHRYIFTVHALKTARLEVPPEATNAIVRFMIEGATIQKAKLQATYER